MAQCARKTSARYTIFYLLGRWQEEKCNGHRKSCEKRSITFRNAWLPLLFMLWNGSGKPTQPVISFWLWAKAIYTVLWLKQRKAVRDAKNAVATILLLKTHQKWFLFHHLPWSLRIFINMFTFRCSKANFMEICEKISFPSFFRRMLMSAFLLTELQG